MNRKDKSIKELAKDIMTMSNDFGEVKELAQAILDSESLEDINIRLVTINAIAHRIIAVSGNTTDMWLNAYRIKNKVTEEEEASLAILPEALQPTEEDITKVREEVGDD